MAELIKAVKEEELPRQKIVSVTLQGDTIALTRTDDGIFAFADACTHAGCSLSDGQVVGESVECHCHGARFDLRTGGVLALPATSPIKTYPVKVEDGWVMVEL